MTGITTHSILQTAVVTQSRAIGMARMADIFAAVPTDRPGGVEDAKHHGTVFAFNNNTYFEVLDPLAPGHTRQRFLTRNGPGAYMLSCALENSEVAPVSAALQAAGVRAVIEGPFGENHVYRWHMHPKDAGGLLVLSSIMKDRRDNTDWAGPHFNEDAAFNTRYVSEIRGLIGRSTDPETESPAFTAIGFTMQPLGGGGHGWRGPTQNALELWPQDAWLGENIDKRRDYAVLIKPSDREGLLRRMGHLGFTFQPGVAGGRLLSSIDPDLGVRFAIED
jgi:hypothetical protein